MNDKERFHAIMNFEPSDRILYWEQGYWAGTIERWYQEGMEKKYGVEGNPAYGQTVRGPATPLMPKDRFCRDVFGAAGLDKPTLKVPVELYLSPLFEEEVLEEHEDQIIMRDEYGIIKRTRRAMDSIPYYLSWPVKDASDFERLVEERLDPNSSERFPPDWNDQVQTLNSYDGVVAMGSYPCGFFGAPRFLMGEMELLIGFIEAPQLIRRIINHLADLWSILFDRVLSEVKVDCIHVWEDMSYKNGPLISPAHFEALLQPAYKKITDVAKSHGVEVIFVDTDGDCSLLIPHFIEGGVTGLYPFEVQAGMDIRQVREAFPKLQILGGINKVEIAGGSDRIDAELERRIPGMISKGGFVPMVDHQVPPDVSWEDYLYYRKRLAELAESYS